MDYVLCMKVCNECLRAGESGGESERAMNERK